MIGFLTLKYYFFDTDCILLIAVFIHLTFLLFIKSNDSKASEKKSNRNTTVFKINADIIHSKQRKTQASTASKYVSPLIVNKDLRNTIFTSYDYKLKTIIIKFPYY